MGHKFFHVYVPSYCFRLLDRTLFTMLSRWILVFELLSVLWAGAKDAAPTIPFLYVVFFTLPLYLSFRILAMSHEELANIFDYILRYHIMPYQTQHKWQSTSLYKSHTILKDTQVTSYSFLLWSCCLQGELHGIPWQSLAFASVLRPPSFAIGNYSR